MKTALMKWVAQEDPKASKDKTLKNSFRPKTNLWGDLLGQQGETQQGDE